MTFSDFVIKKQIQSRQIRKRLVEVAGCEKILKFMLTYILSTYLKSIILGVIYIFHFHFYL